jgi:hypothetical protein
MLHVYVGHQLAQLADHGDKMDAKTKAVSYASIAIGITMGFATGWLIYAQTKKRTKELEELERVEAGLPASEYADDSEYEEDAAFLREQDDDVSLRDAWDDNEEYFDQSSDATPSGSQDEGASDNVTETKHSVAK